MIGFLSILAVGFFLGMRHATDPDHVIAVTTIVSNQRNSAREGQNTEKHTVDGRRVSLALLRARQPWTDPLN